MGINVNRVYLVTFTLGTMLAAIGGALTAPTVSVVPGMGVEMIVLAFAVVVIGGLGLVQGAALGALIVGWSARPPSTSSPRSSSSASIS